MKYKELTKSDIKWIGKLYASKEPRKEIQKSIATKFGVKRRTVRDWAKKLELVNKPSTDFVVAQNKVLEEKKYYIVSWGQNSTPVHMGFLQNMQAYADFINAEISIIAGRYRNPTSIFPDSDKEVWRKEIRPYLDANRQIIHEHMELLSDIKIHPTARMPLSSFEGISSGRSCVIGHPRVHQKVVPALNGYKPKMMLTTGACTVRNYTDSKAGKIGEFHHTLGFVIIEIDGDDFYVRQVTADEDTGAFTDLNKYVSKGIVKQAEQAEAIVFGDIHVGDHDGACITSTLKVCDVLQPKVAVLHDLLNGHSVNRHEQKNPFKRFEKLQEGNHTLKGEIDDVVEFTKVLVDEMDTYLEDVVVVNSNHDAWIEAYLVNSDWKKDIPNALSYMKYSTMMLQGETPKGVFASIIDEEFEDTITTLALDESYRLKDWEFGVHGHEGTNGSRGNPNQFKKLSTKMITGHTHSPSRIDGVVTVGTSTYLRVGYNTGASGWLQSHAILNADGKVQQIHCINYKFTTLL
tara:strand:- start:25851 stop:27404 length:1554 start_codon:yes stop_codon:yes gene_type:complete